MAKKKRPPAPTVDSFKTEMRRLIGERWTVVWETIPAAIAGDDVEGVHDVRVASRRLRAAMDVAAVCFPSSWYKPLHKAAKEITSELGEVRDRDVLIVALQVEREAAPAAELPGIDYLIEQIEGERTAARAEMERYLHELLASKVPAATVKRFGATVPAPKTEETA